MSTVLFLWILLIKQSKNPNLWWGAIYLSFHRRSVKEFYGHVYKCHSDLNLDSCPYKRSFTDTLNCNTLNFIRVSEQVQLCRIWDISLWFKKSGSKSLMKLFPGCINSPWGLCWLAPVGQGALSWNLVQGCNTLHCSKTSGSWACWKTCQPSDAYASYVRNSPKLGTLHFLPEKFPKQFMCELFIVPLCLSYFWGCGWLSTKWTQLPEKTVGLFSVSPGNTTLFVRLDLLLGKNFSNHTICISPARELCQSWEYHTHIRMGHGVQENKGEFLCNKQKV